MRERRLRRSACEVAGELGGESRAVVDGRKTAVVAEQAFAPTGALRAWPWIG
jgi:hypothetical protein